MTENFDKIYSFIDANPDWQKKADTNQDDLLEYGELKAYLSEHIDWSGESSSKEDIIDAYWNKILEDAGDEGTEDVPQAPTRSVGADIGNAVNDVISGGSSGGSDLVENFLNFGTDCAAEKVRGSVTAAELKPIIDIFQDSEQMAAFIEEWQQSHEISTMGDVMNCLSDYAKSSGISFSQVLSALGTGTLFAIGAKILIQAGLDVVPKFAKDMWNNTKNIFSNLFTGKIGKFAKNLYLDTPVMLVRNAGRFVKSIGVNTWNTVTGIVKAVGNGVYDTADTLISGISNSWKKVGNGIGGGVSKLLKGNVIGAAGSVVGGVVSGAFEAGKTVVKTFGKAIKTVGNVATAVFGNPLKTAVNLAGSVVKGVVKGVGSVVSGIAKGIGKLFSGW